jgi:transcription antitermination factor NusG
MPWIVIRTAANSEFRVAHDLREAGFHSYCPIGKKIVTWTNGRRTKSATAKIYPVFSRYLFVECQDNHLPHKRSVDRIEAILSDASGPRFVPSQSIETIQQLENSGEWDETVFRAEKSVYQPGDAIRIVSGAFAQFPGVIAALRPDFRLDVSINIFGRQNTIPLDACQIEAM